MSTPLSKITLYKIPALDNTYRDSYYFHDVTTQSTFFNRQDHAPKTLSPKQVQRITNNQVKVPYPISDLRDYNYMSITNGTYGDTEDPSDKTFYCFITNVEYVSDMCTLITYEVDVIQTFIPVEAYLREAFVERCHSDTDEMFDNRVPEPFDFNNYQGKDEVTHTSVFYVVIGISAGTEITLDGTTNFDTEPCYIRFGRDGRYIYSGSEFYIFNPANSSDRTKLENLINKLVDDGHTEAISDFYAVPQDAYWENTGGKITSAPDTGTSAIFDFHTIAPDSGVYGSGTLDGGYVPTNNKLYSYPFCFCRILNNTGDYLDLKWEEFMTPLQVGANKYRGAVSGSWFGGGEACFIPLDYAYQSNDQPYLLPAVNRNYALPLQGFPNCPVANNAYKDWASRNVESRTLSSVIGAVAGYAMAGALTVANPALGGLATMARFGAGVSFVKNTAEITADAVKAGKMPNETGNKQTSPMVQISNGLFGFTAVRVSLEKETLKELDDYFTMYGYAYKKRMNIRTYLNNSKRAKFCYIRTSGFNVQGNIPTYYKNIINEIFNSGITFWKTDATVGDYSDNNIVVTP